ncbi:MDR family MFS transporter [Novosphingobium sp. BW1]|uniref:MDR family MFS transporter n=1 Tax=Novosphingobium sp. BW1 TaxID=2592621 RepID=UPI0011DE968C|nr:MDR family MFS transporter [Novosphingobium sp. BW1]TYC89677.1 MFS transporter [Novosphingobium sp. BW1]
MSAADSVEAPAQGRLRFWATLVGLLMTTALASLDNFIINPALPLIVSEFGGLERLSWVMTAFMLASTATMPLYGKFSDIYGRRALFTVSITFFLLGSLLCGLASSMLQLILFRAVQGLGAGGVQVLAMTTMGDIVSPRERPRYQGLFNLTNLLAGIAGPVVGGAVTQYWGWRWVFYINLPIGTLALAVLWFVLPRRLAHRREHVIDFPGIALLVVGTVSFLLLLGALEGTRAVSVWEMAALALACVGAFTLLIWQERRSAEPILAVGMLANPVFARTVLSSAMIGLAFFGSSVYLPLFFQMVGGLSTAQSGLMLLPHVIAGTAVSLIGGQIIARTGRYKTPIVGGMALLACGFFCLAAVTRLELGLPAWIVSCMMMGAGGGLCMPNLMVALQNTVPREDLGLGTSSMQFCNQLAAVAGVGIAGLILSQQIRANALAWFPGERVEEVVSQGAVLARALGPEGLSRLAQVYENAFLVNFAMGGGLTVLAALVATRIPQIRLSERIGGGPAPARTPEAPVAAR